MCAHGAAGRPSALREGARLQRRLPGPGTGWSRSGATRSEGCCGGQGAQRARRVLRAVVGVGGTESESGGAEGHRGGQGHRDRVRAGGLLGLSGAAFSLLAPPEGPWEPRGTPLLCHTCSPPTWCLRSRTGGGQPCRSTSAHLCLRIHSKGILPNLIRSVSWRKTVAN